MFYSDDETRKNEDLFQQQLKAAREYLANNKDYIHERLIFMNTVLVPILQKEHKTQEEIDLLFSTEKEIMDLREMIKAATDLIGESLERKSISFYNIVKQKALEGNEEANKIYLELQPMYKGLVERKISNN